MALAFGIVAPIRRVIHRDAGSLGSRWTWSCHGAEQPLITKNASFKAASQHHHTSPNAGQLRSIATAGRNIACNIDLRFRASHSFEQISSATKATFSSQAAPQRQGPRLTDVTKNDSEGCYRLSLDNGFEGTYPYVWLRDNCRCPQCYHPSSWQRTSKIADLDPDITPVSEQLLGNGGFLRIVWPDQHSSDFDAAWLNRQRFADAERDFVSSPELRTWGGELNGSLPSFDFQKVLEEDGELYNWLDVLNTRGLAIVHGAPTRKGANRELAERVAYLKTTIYGEAFQVFSKHNASNLAYTPAALCLHIDLPFYNYTPGIQMLHCIEQANATTGGENQFVDGLNVAEQVRKEFPETYNILRTWEVDFRDAGSDYRLYHLKQKRPVIQYNKYGEFQSVNYNDHVRAPSLSLPVDQVREMYRAMKLFQKVMYRPGNLVQHRLQAGEIVTFNNGRVLHGRSSYTITGAGSRHLEGGYIDWDEAHSRMRILRENLFGDERL